MLLVISMIVSAVGSIFIAFLTVLRNPRVATYRWLFLFLLAASAWIISTNLQGVLTPALNLGLLRFGFVAASIMAFSMVRFVANLCDRVSGIMPKISGILAVVAVALSISPLVIEGYSEASTEGFVPIRGPAYPVVIAIILYFIISAVWALSVTRRHTRGQRRHQLSIVLAGIIAGAIIGITTNVVLPNIVHNTSPSRFAFLAIIAWALLLGYAIWRHRFLDVRWAAARAIGYALTILTIAFFYAFGVAIVATNVVEHLAASTLQVYYIVAGVLAAVIFGPLRSFFDRFTNRVFFSDAYILQEVLDRLGELLAGTIKIDRIMQGALAILSNSIKPVHLHVVLMVDHQPVIASAGRTHIDLEPIVGAFGDMPKDVLLSDIFDQEPSRIQRTLSEHGIAAAAPLQTSKGGIGFLLVGYKRSGRLLSRQDDQLIRLAADQLALALQNGLRFREIQEFNRTLEFKIKDATAQLRDSNQKLKKLDEAKDEFISMASHQLRTPLTSVKGYISMVLDGDSGAITTEQRKLLEEAFMSSQRMVYLIGDFLNVSRLQTGKFVLERHPVDLSQVVQAEIDQLAITAERRNITIEYHKPSSFPLMQLDDNKMRQVIMNFIDNAIFYSHPDSKVLVALVATAREIRLTVHDTGIGVPESERRRLFSKFFRAHNARKIRPDGTGIGLFMAKKVITAHGGSLIFESRENRGSTFGFSLPMKDQPQQLQQQ